MKTQPRKFKKLQEKERIRKQKYQQKETLKNPQSPFGSKVTFGKGLEKLNRSLPDSPDKKTVLLRHALDMQKINDYSTSNRLEQKCLMKLFEWWKNSITVMIVFVQIQA